MRSELAKAIRKRFKQRLSDEVPQFTPSSDRSIKPGDLLFVWQMSPELQAYLMLQFHKYEDWFTLEVAWTRNGKWPAVAPLPRTVHETPDSGELRFRIGTLWERPEKDVWWELAPAPPLHSVVPLEVPIDELMPKVDHEVEDAVQHIRDDVVPYLRGVASRQAT